MPLAADGRPAAVLKIAGTEHRLADGEYLLWDDTFPHEVTNDSDEVRTVLLLDVWRRGMPLDMRLLSHLLIFIVRVMARLRGVVRLADHNHPTAFRNEGVSTTLLPWARIGRTCWTVRIALEVG